MTKAKRRASVKAWALYRDGIFYMATAHRYSTAAVFVSLAQGSKHEWTIVRVEIKELPHGR